MLFRFSLKKIWHACRRNTSQNNCKLAATADSSLQIGHNIPSFATRVLIFTSSLLCPAMLKSVLILLFKQVTPPL